METVKIGENNHSEYGWSDNTREKITQLAFQLTRTSDKIQIAHIKTIYRDLLKSVYDVPNPDMDNLYATLALTLQTRDIVAGKGEYELYYVLIGELSLFADKINSTKINSTLNLLITGTVDLGEDHPYGSWKDIKYLLNYLRTLYG